MATRLLGNILLGVVGALGVVFTAAAIRASWGGSYWVFGAVVGVVLTACALARSRFPVTAAGVGLAVAAAAIAVAGAAGLPREPGPIGALALAVLIATVVRDQPLRTSGAVTVGGLTVVAGSIAVGGAAPVPMVTSVGWACALAAGLGLRLLDARRHAAREAVRRDERLELARELHDVVAHHVTGIVVQAQAAQLVARRGTAVPLEALAGIETAGTDALAAMRRVVGVLRDSSDAVLLASEELPALLDRFAALSGQVLHREIAQGDRPPEVTSTVYRIVQESLTNVTQHAPQAGSVSVTVAQEPAGLIVEVVDDAPSSAVPPHRRGYGHRTGYGLLGMRERVESLGGTLSAGPREGGGWSVRATIPVLARGTGTPGTATPGTATGRGVDAEAGVP